MAAFSAARQLQGKAAYGGQACVVEVQGYTRFRHGKPEEVSGYERSNPYCDDAHRLRKCRADHGAAA